MALASEAAGIVMCGAVAAVMHRAVDRVTVETHF